MTDPRNSWTLAPDSEPATPDQQALSDAFVSASRALVGIAVRSIEASDVGVTVVQHRVLVLLEAEGDLSVGTLATLLGVNPSNASRICDRLERMTLIERLPSRDDGRAVTIRITEGGRTVVDAVNQQRTDEIAHILARMSQLQARRSVAAMQSFADAARRIEIAEGRVGE